MLLYQQVNNTSSLLSTFISLASKRIAAHPHSPFSMLSQNFFSHLPWIGHELDKFFNLLLLLKLKEKKKQAKGTSNI